MSEWRREFAKIGSSSAFFSVGLNQFLVKLLAPIGCPFGNILRCSPDRVPTSLLGSRSFDFFAIMPLTNHFI